MAHAEIPALTVDPSALPGRRSADLHDALARRDVAGRWLYESPAQARLWLAYHQAYSPSRTDASLGALYGQAFAEALRRGGVAGSRGHLHLVSLGCGGGHKDAALLALARERSPGADALHYTPLDISAVLVREAARHVADLLAPLQIHPIVADLAQRPELASWLATQDGETPWRLFACFGMLPNFNHVAFPAYLRGLLRPGDRLLLSANLSPQGFPADCERIVPQYDNAHARRWYEALLAHLGIPAQAMSLQVSAAPLAEDGSAWRIQAHATAAIPVRFTVEGRGYALAPGERLRVFFSNRFTEAGILRLLAVAGLTLQGQWLHAGGEEGIFLCAPAQGD